MALFLTFLVCLFVGSLFYFKKFGIVFVWSIMIGITLVGGFCLYKIFDILLNS